MLAAISRGRDERVTGDRGDVDAARKLLQQEADADRPLYDEVQRRGIEYARVRLVQEPLTAYLRYELLSYRIRAQLGETIEVVRCDSNLRLPDDRHFDFLLFDEHTALIHDYGTDEIGLQTDGWVTHDPTTVAALEATIIALRHDAEPLHRYLTTV